MSDNPTRTIRACIEELYGLPECSTGGPLHIIVDDENVEDHHLDFCRQALEEGRHWSMDDADPVAVEAIKLVGKEILDRLSPLVPRDRIRVMGR